MTTNRRGGSTRLFAENEDEVRAELVHAVGQRIAAGKYVAAAEVVAVGMVEEALFYRD